MANGFTSKHQLNIDRLELWFQPIEHVPKLKDIVAGIFEIFPKQYIKFILYTLKIRTLKKLFKLYDFMKSYQWNIDQEDYYLHITTGTHVMQVCYFALAEANIIPAKLIQTGEDPSIKDKIKQIRGNREKAKQAAIQPEVFDRSKGILQIIDLRSERYTKIASRFQEQNLQTKIS